MLVCVPLRERPLWKDSGEDLNYRNFKAVARMEQVGNVGTLELQSWDALANSFISIATVVIVLR